MLRFIVLVLFCLSYGAPLEAQQPSEYPLRSVRIIVPSSPGGGTDILARVLADFLAKSLGGHKIETVQTTSIDEAEPACAATFR